MAPLPRIDAGSARSVAVPVTKTKDHWEGAPSIAFDPSTQTFYLYRRSRAARPVRGGRCSISESSDGVHFREVWSMSKESLGSTSIERGALTRSHDGDWLLYLSYVDPADDRWRIDVMRAPNPAAFDPATRQPLLTAESTGTEGVKDPVIYRVAGEYHLYFCYTQLRDGGTHAELHGTSDAFNSGRVKTASGRAISRDPQHFGAFDPVLTPPEEGWDSDTVRTTCIVALDDGYAMFYDGKAGVAENYEERTGYAISYDLTNWRRATIEAPLLVSPWGTGSLRYLDVIRVEDRHFAYYEVCAPDGSHALVCNVLAFETRSATEAAARQHRPPTHPLREDDPK